jgi:uncharacterized membrane protein YqiK
LVDVFVGIVVVVSFLVVVWSKMTIMKTSDMTIFFVASTMRISTLETVRVLGGAHWKDPVFATANAMSTMTTVASFAPAGTRWMSRGAISPVVSQEII